LAHGKDRDYISRHIHNNVFYGEDMAYKSDIIFITEGITDCITLNQYGYPSISPATVRFRNEDYEKLAKLLNDKTVYICNDNEENNAGLEGAKETAGKLLKRGILAKIILLPEPSLITKILGDKNHE